MTLALWITCAGDVVYFHFYKGFDFEIWVRWVGSWLDLLVEKAVLSGTKFSRQLMTSDAPQGLMLMTWGMKLSVVPANLQITKLGQPVMSSNLEGPQQVGKMGSSLWIL